MRRYDILHIYDDRTFFISSLLKIWCFCSLIASATYRWWISSYLWVKSVQVNILSINCEVYQHLKRTCDIIWGAHRRNIENNARNCVNFNFLLMHIGHNFVVIVDIILLLKQLKILLQCFCFLLVDFAINIYRSDLCFNMKYLLWVHLPNQISHFLDILKLRIS
jgi:hypothetical protein